MKSQALCNSPMGDVIFYSIEPCSAKEWLNYARAQKYFGFLMSNFSHVQDNSVCGFEFRSPTGLQKWNRFIK